jgi:serine/threonine protein kinase
VSAIDDTDRGAPTVDERRPARRLSLDRGACLGRYVILEPIGFGGMGVVYKAYDPELNRTVALKLLRTDEGGAATRLQQRLMREAQALARLSHPNVIAVHDIGTLGVHVFVAMEFVDGMTLRRWLTAGTRPRREILDAYRAAGEGLAAAHRAGLVHRDFKPDNVMVGNDGRIRVLDFGLVRAAGGAASAADDELGGDAAAKSADAPRDDDGATARELTTPASDAAASVGVVAAPVSASHSRSGASSRLSQPLTQAGAVLGTPRFMAPEQHRGRNVDERADQFSFCFSLYESLTGTPPFADAEAVVDHRLAELPPGVRLPRRVRRALLRGLALRPEARHRSMAALLTALGNDARRTRVWVALALLLALAGAAVASRAQAHRRLRACRDAARPLADSWDASRRAAVRSAFHASGQPYADAVLVTVERAFDDYADGWATMRIDACEATEGRGEQSREMLALRSACLTDRLAELGALAELYAGADGALIEHAAAAAQSLPSLGACADATALRGPLPLPADSASRRRVAQIREQLARVDALLLAAQYDPSLRLARAARAAADSLRYQPVEAETALALARALDGRGQYAESLRMFQEALVAAVAGRHDAVQARAALGVLVEIGARLRRLDEAEPWLELAEAAIARVPHDELLRADFYAARAELRALASRHHEERDDAERALALRLHALAPHDVRVAASYRALARAQNAAGALESSRRALAIDLHALGSEHPDLVGDEIAIGDALAALGQSQAARTEYAKALALLRRVNPDAPAIAALGEKLTLAGAN